MRQEGSGQHNDEQQQTSVDLGRSEAQSLCLAEENEAGQGEKEGARLEARPRQSRAGKWPHKGASKVETCFEASGAR